MIVSNAIRRQLRRGQPALVALIVVGSVGCGDSGVQVGPDLPGAISVTTETSGFNKDDGYELLVDGASEGMIGANDAVTVPDLDPATYTVDLSDVATNCTATASAGSATVVSQQTAEITITIVCEADAATPYSLRSSRDRLNLEDGVVTVCSFGICPTELGWDFYFEMPPGGSPSAIIRANGTTGVELAHVTGTTLSTLTEADVTGATFTTDPIDDAFSTDRVVLVRTDEGNVYGLGDPVENTTLLTLDFNAVLLVPAP